MSISKSAVIATMVLIEAFSHGIDGIYVLDQNEDVR